MPVLLSELRELQDKRVRMRFDDDLECIATVYVEGESLLSIEEVMPGT